MKAYIVSTDEFSHACFSDYNMKARRVVQQAFGLEPDEITGCKRAPELDQYLPMWQQFREIDRETLLKHGWWFLCDECEGMVSNDMQNGDGETTQPVAGGGLFCSVACQQSADARRTKRGEALAALK